MTEKMLITTDQIKPVDIFIDGKYSEVLEFIKTESTIEKPDVKTAKGRALIKSMAAKVASSKVFIEKARKELSDNERKKIDETLSLIIGSGNFIEDSLIYLKAEVREPLTIWENEKKAVENAEKLEAEIIENHVEALEDNKLFDDKKQVEIDKKKLEADRMQLEADEKAKAKAEEQQAEKQAKILRDKANAEAETERLKQKVIDDANQAEIDKKIAIESERIKVEAEVAKKEADRVKAEEVKRIEDEAKAADKDHRKKLNNEALEDMNKVLSEQAFDSDLDSSKVLIIAIAQGKIRNISIKY